MANTFNHNGKVVINDDGQMSINTTNFAYVDDKLYVDGNIIIPNNKGYLQATTGGNRASIISLNSSNNLTVGQSNVNNANLFLYGGTGNVTINAGATEVARFTTSGNVGIGTTSPGEKLEVAGAIKLGSNSTIPSAGISHYTNGYLYIKGGTSGAAIGNDDFSSAVYVVDNGSIEFYAGSSNKMHITSAGNVGIGTTSPVSTLDVNGIISSRNIYIAQNSGTYNLIYNASNSVAMYLGGSADQGNYYDNTTHYFRSAGGGATYAVINYLGNVGIGTTSPAQKLQVNGAIQAGPSSVAGGPIIYQSYASPNYIGSIGSEYSSGAVLIGYGATGKSGASGYVSTFENFSGVRGLLRLASGSFSVLSSTTAVNTAIGGDLTMTTTFTVTDAGNVGIGTTSPGSKLQVEGTNPFIRVNNTSANDHGIKISYNGSDAHGLHLLYNANSAVSYIDNTYQAVSGQVYGDIYVRQNVGGTMTPRITIKADGGNVGIGTTTPASIGTGITTLDIQGSSAGGVAFGPSGVKNYIYGASTMYVEAHTTAVFTTSGSEKMRLTTGGQLIVGGTTVGYSGTKLQVGNTSDAQNGLNILTSTTGYGYILFGDGAGADTYVGQIWYYHGDNYMGFQTNGGERMRITSSGNVGIGTTSPASALQIGSVGSTGYSVGNGLAFGDGTRAGALNVDSNGTTLYSSTNLIFSPGTTEAVRITTSGNVGIGTTSPTQKLDVAGNININSVSYTYKINGFDTISASSTYTNIHNPEGAISIYLGDSADRTNYYDNNAHRFRSAGGGTTYAAITSAGNVGIGTTSPDAKLVVVGSGTGVAKIGDAGFGSGNYTGISLNGTLSTSNYNILSSPTDSTLYINRPTGATIQFRENNTTQVIIAASGNVGIGTTSPGARLTVLTTTSSSADSFRVTDGTGVINVGHWDTVTNRFEFSGKPTKFVQYGAGNYISFGTLGSENMRIVAGGNVGIGTTAPGYKLEVSGSVGVGANSGQNIIYNSFNDVGALFQRVGSYGEVVRLGRWGVSNSVTLDYPTDGTFAISTNSSERMRITAAGNVGIGTTSPSEKLHVDGNVIVTYNNSFQGINSIGNKAILARVSPTTGIINYAEYATATNLNGFVLGSDDARVKGDIATDSLDFITNTSSRMFINSSGNVGIGTTSPTDKLAVDGNISIFSANKLYNGSAADSAGISFPSNVVRIDGYSGITFNSSTTNIGSQTERMRITNSGNVGIGTTGPSYKLDVVGDARITSGSLGVGVAPNATDGRIDASNDIVAYSTSDQRLKENVTPIENALEKVKTLTGVEFDWKEETAHVHGYHGHDVGIIAQDVQAVLPEAVRTNDSGYLSVRYEKMIALLIEANKELAARVEELEKKLK